MKQGYNDRLNESIGSRNGKKSQSMKDRRDESKGMSYRHKIPAHVHNVKGHLSSLIKK